MEFKYSPDQIKKKNSLVLLKLSEEGFQSKIVNIEKTTLKKVYFDQYLESHDYRNQLFYEEVGGELNSIGTVVGAGKSNIIYVHKTILLFEEDVERAKKHIKEIALEKLEIQINNLQQQLDLLKELN